MKGIGRRLPSGIPGRYQLELAFRRSLQGLKRTRQRVAWKDTWADRELPVLLGNSFPKSGTNLLRQVLGGFTRLGPFVDVSAMTILTFHPETGRKRSERDIAREIRSLHRGDIAAAHLHAVPEVIDASCEPWIVHYFIFRDPRDVVVSHMHYVTYMRRAHVHHCYYREVLKNDEERILTSIQGTKASLAPLPNIRERFEPYLGWLDREEILSIRFEDLIARPQEVIPTILEHYFSRGYDLPSARDEAVKTLVESIRPEQSKTFRSGKIGSWREEFTPRARDEFKALAGELLIRLGYERDLDW